MKIPRWQRAVFVGCLICLGAMPARAADATFGTSAVRPIIKDLKTIMAGFRKTKTAADATKLQKTLTDMASQFKKDTAAFDAAATNLQALIDAKKPLTADQKKAVEELKTVSYLETEVEGHKARILKLNPKIDAAFKDLDL